MTQSQIILGPFKQIVTMQSLPIHGRLHDEELIILQEHALLIEDEQIIEIAPFEQLKHKAPKAYHQPSDKGVLFPGIIDAHTHLCFVSERSDEYAMRLCGKSYLEIATAGGGIANTVSSIRKASFDELFEKTLSNLRLHLARGITCCEVKSGYGLSVEEELKMLRVIKKAALCQPITVVPTALAAHTVPEGSSAQKWLQEIETSLWPTMLKEKLANRVDIFIEECAFGFDEALEHLKKADKIGLQCTAHVNQFQRGGAFVAAKSHCISADHLETISEEEINALREKNVAAVLLPCASLGLGVAFAPARHLLDAGLSVVIASDWNPGSAPMGDLLVGAALMGAAEKLTMAETWAAMTTRAAAALGLEDRGFLAAGSRADAVVYPCNKWQEVLYYQGALKPSQVFIGGREWLKENN